MAGVGRPRTTERKSAGARRINMWAAAREWDFLAAHLGPEKLATKILNLALVACVPGALVDSAATALEKLSTIRGKK